MFCDVGSFFGRHRGAELANTAGTHSFLGTNYHPNQRFGIETSPAASAQVASQGRKNLVFIIASKNATSKKARPQKTKKHKIKKAHAFSHAYFRRIHEPWETCPINVRQLQYRFAFSAKRASIELGGFVVCASAWSRVKQCAQRALC